MTIADLPAILSEIGLDVPLLDFLRELRRVGDVLAEQKRREGIEMHTSVRFERTLRSFGIEADRAAQAALRMAALHMQTLADAVVCPPDRCDLLHALSADYRLALLSNFDCGATARAILSRHGLAPHFETIVISQEEGVRKPARAIFEAVCTRLGTPPGDCLYIGDTLVEDIEGATGAGLGALWIRRDVAGIVTPASSPAAAVLADVAALPHWLASSR